MHSSGAAQKRVDELGKGKAQFMELSRNLARAAQQRERQTVQPKEHLSGVKALLTIKNYLGGYYHLTSDEAEVFGDSVRLIEAKHTELEILPSISDVKDGLIKMVLFSNLKDVKIGDSIFTPIPILKLTTKTAFSALTLKAPVRGRLQLLVQEAQENGFQVWVNNEQLPA